MKILKPAEIKIIRLKNKKMLDIILVFEKITIREIEESRPRIIGVDYRLLKFIGEIRFLFKDHKDPQKWDFMEWNGKAALLIPKRYVIFSFGRLKSIYLQSEA